MATLYSLDSATTITESQNKFLELCEIIFQARDFSKVEKEIADASKIRFGLQCIDSSLSETFCLTEDLVLSNEDVFQKIIVGLNKLSKVYLNNYV